MVDKSLVTKLSLMVTELYEISKIIKIKLKEGGSGAEENRVGFREEDIKKILSDSLNMENKISSKSGYSEENVRLLYTLSSHALIALENILLFEKTKRMSVLDEMTSTYNHRYFQIRLKEERSRAVRYNFPLGLMMIDIDSFKKYNDSYGHINGDKMLKKIADIIGQHIRGIDILCRYGGDEFAVILPNTDLEQGNICSVAERVRRKIDEEDFLFGKGKKKFKVTLSIGISFYPRDNKTVEGIINLADKALYAAKKAGGNKAVIYNIMKAKKKVKK